MGQVILYTGGARSGKSRLAETRAEALGAHCVYVATAAAGDEEMSDRIAAHKARRGVQWSLIEEPRDLHGALVRSVGQGPRLVDCLTLWLSNLLLDDADIEGETQALVDALAVQSDPVIFVTNEVGDGIVPENALSRRFRDAAGRLNQTIAARADEVILVTAGLPLTLKSGA